MPRLRSPIRDKAFEMWRDSDGKMPLKDIAHQLNVSPSQVRNWKTKDQWDKVAQLNANDCATKRGGAPKENQNAVGNHGGAPAGNSNAVTHGFFRKHFPDAVHDLIDDIGQFNQIDMLWVAIQTQFTAIIHAQKVMFVRDQGDETKVLTRVKQSDTMDEHEWGYQHAWDKQANFLQAQSRAISELRASIKSFLEISDESDLRRLRLQQMQKNIELKSLEIERLRGDGGESEDDGFLEALEGKVSEVWDDDGESEA